MVFIRICFISQEFDSVLKCSSDSDSELNGTSTATCFGRINPAQLFNARKRSRSDAHPAQPQLPSESVLPTPTKSTTPKHTLVASNTVSPVATPPIRHWFQPGVGSISALAQNSQMMLTSTPEQRTDGKSTLNDSDPTYGMAAYAHHRSIATDFNADDDDNASLAAITDDAPVGDCKRQRLFVVDSGAVMSPLQHRNVDGSLATIRKKTRMPVVGGFEQNAENCQPSSTKRKRVQFDMDANRVDYANRPYNFAAEPMQPVRAPATLRSRIAGFFASLF